MPCESFYNRFPKPFLHVVDYNDLIFKLQKEAMVLGLKHCNRRIEEFKEKILDLTKKLKDTKNFLTRVNTWKSDIEKTLIPNFEKKIETIKSFNRRSYNVMKLNDHNKSYHSENSLNNSSIKPTTI